MNAMEARTLFLCVEYLHRMPEEVDLPIGSMVNLMAYHEAKKRASGG
jgi:hypothetical protein